MITFEVFEESGPVVGNRGIVTAVTNFNWKRTGGVDQAYYFYPLRRPTMDRDQTLSFKKYIFFKISGDYTYLKNIKITLKPLGDADTDGTQLFYKFTNTYAEPDATYDGAMINAGSKEISWFPTVSETSPQLATAHVTSLNNKTFYTGYLVTQLRVNSGAFDAVGNSMGFELKLSLQEFE